MSIYALIYNNEIKVGPRTWHYGFFNNFLTSNNLDNSNLPLTDPNSEVIGNNWSILPVLIDTAPSYQSPFQQLAGPFLTINANNVTGYYTVANCTVDFIQNILKNKVTENRYIVETMGCSYTFPDGNTVSLLTDRTNRNMYLQAAQLIPDSNTQILFKFPNNYFRLVTKADMANVSNAVAYWVQDAFNWESNTYIQIESSTTIDALMNINTVNPNQPNNTIRMV